MKKEAKDYLPLYLGCKCKTFHNEGEDAVTLTEMNIEAAIRNEWKPILRPFGQITEAEQEEWNKISTPIGEMAIESALQIHWAKRLNYYRSIGIDCDELIESGLAIDKTKI